MKENLFLADCSQQEIASIAEELVFDGRPTRIKVHIANWKRSGMLSELRRYAAYFWVAFRYLLKRSRYEMIIGWQQFYALIFCFYCSLFRLKKKNTVVALNFTYREKKGILAGPYRWFMKKCLDLRYMDFLHVLSESYKEKISEDFDFPGERIIAAAFGVEDAYHALSQLKAPEGFEKGSYALAIGRSNRDYDFLIHAWKDIAYPLVIISDTYKGTTEGNGRILHLKNVAGEASYPWIANCGLMIIPIADGMICSGDTVLLTAMSLGKKILVSCPSTLAEMYVADGHNAILFEKSERALQAAVWEALQEDKYREIGNRARADFLKRFSRKRMGENIRIAVQQRKAEV